MIKIHTGMISLKKWRSSGKRRNAFTKTILLFGLLAFIGWSCNNTARKTKSQLKIGAYYFDGWAGQNRHDGDTANPWAKNAPTHLTRSLAKEFSNREPVWGWRDDSLAIMERQIDLAADNGIEFFLFCWYWRDSNGSINPEAIENLNLHTSMNLYLKAKNKNRIKFGLLVANHQGSEIIGTENWEKATEYWMKYFKDPQHVKVDGKPLVVIFNSRGIDNDALALMQKVAKKQGLPGLTIAGCGKTDFTAGKSFAYRTVYNANPGYVAGLEEHKYSELADAHIKQWIGTEEQPCIPTIIAGWDKRPMGDKEADGAIKWWPGWYFPDRTPEQFKKLLNDAITWMDQHPTQTAKERIVLVYAWNELGEGGYLVPTKGDPEASYLKVIRSVVSGK
jgi:hypothetical protein